MYVEPSQGVFDFGPGSVVAHRAAKNKQLLRCHNLVWHSQLPDWVNNGVWGKKNLTDVLINHITHVAGHWKGRCYAWDVVNEGLNDDGTYRETVFYKTLGEEYFKIAFATAARIDPHAKLYYNDYNLEAPSAKSTAAQNIVKMLRKAGIKIDGIGAQAHLIVGSTPSIDAQIANIKAFTALGVEVAQTELDIRLNLPSTPENLEQQRKDYEATVGACMQVKGCVGTTVWDFYDPVS
jgi:endo-1,4-beta-xylanase